MRPPIKPALAGALAAVLCLLASSSGAQEIEPRQFSNAPVGVNFLIAGYAYARGGLAIDPAIPLTETSLRTSSAVLAYARALDIFGMSGKIDAELPYTWLSGSALYKGEPAHRHVDGPNDPTFRISVNFYGAPALTLPELAQWKQDLILGASLRVFVPLGQYDDTKVINIGANRWSFKPEVGASKAIGAWTFEATAGAQFYTVNEDFYYGHRRTQDPVYSLQGHVIHSFDSGWWAAFDATYYWGGQAHVDGENSGEKLGNWRYGLTLTAPIDRENSIKFYGSNGVSSRTGANYTLAGAAWQYRWGGGL